MSYLLLVIVIIGALIALVAMTLSIRRLLTVAFKKREAGLSRIGNDLTFDVLKEKSVGELEQIKAALEIEDLFIKERYEGRKARNETYRVFAMAIMTSVITLGTTFLFRNYDYKLNEASTKRERFNELSDHFYSATNPGVKRDYACRLAGLDFNDSDSIVNRERQFFRDECNRLTVSQANIGALQDTITKASLDPSVRNNQQELESIDRQLSAAQFQKDNQKQRDAVRKLDALAKLSPEINSIKEASENTRDLVNEQVKAIEPSKPNAERSDVLWFKEGYFLDILDVRVNLMDIDKRGGTVNVDICHLDPTTDLCDVTLTKDNVGLRAPLEFSYNGSKYRLTLVSIGLAGNNPFKPAAYVFLERY